MKFPSTLHSQLSKVVAMVTSSLACCFGKYVLMAGCGGVNKKLMYNDRVTTECIVDNLCMKEMFLLWKKVQLFV